MLWNKKVRNSNILLITYYFAHLIQTTKYTNNEFTIILLILALNNNNFWENSFITVSTIDFQRFFYFPIF